MIFAVTFYQSKNAPPPLTMPPQYFQATILRLGVERGHGYRRRKAPFAIALDKWPIVAAAMSYRADY